MSDRKTETIEIGRGVTYAKVASRSAEFHRDNDKCSVETACEFKEGFVLFSAKVTTKKGTFTGHSMDKLGGRQKQFEKQETIAVGRALAFAGYLSSGDIACQEEMNDVITPMQLTAIRTKWATLNQDILRGMDYAEQAKRFNEWAHSVVGEDIDYTTHTTWSSEWLPMCWADLGVILGVPFD